ncbi:hypothetical protein HMN09_00002500 [Mycena chlorophos]|uniref:Uncharacterized protein n=1 Tax=Mycena chlorophos TaxID=658473 RepID=A0A8H6TQR1_MYCCL|nr:hypothetical protein HMN09_00002500 [Mycena chlorophos]
MAKTCVSPVATPAMPGTRVDPDTTLGSLLTTFSRGGALCGWRRLYHQRHSPRSHPSSQAKSTPQRASPPYPARVVSRGNTHLTVVRAVHCMPDASTEPGPRLRPCFNCVVSPAAAATIPLQAAASLPAFPQPPYPRPYPNTIPFLGLPLHRPSADLVRIPVDRGQFCRVSVDNGNLDLSSDFRFAHRALVTASLHLPRRDATELSLSSARCWALSMWLQRDDAGCQQPSFQSSDVALLYIWHDVCHCGGPALVISGDGVQSDWVGVW